MSPTRERPPVQTTGWTRPAIPLHYALFLSHAGMFLLPLLLLWGTGAIARDEARQREMAVKQEAALAAAAVAPQLTDERTDTWLAALAALKLDLGPSTRIRLYDAAGLPLASDDATEPAAEVTAALAAALRGDTTTARIAARDGLPAATVAAAPIRGDHGVQGAVVLQRTNRRDLEVIIALTYEAGWRASLIAAVALAFAAFATWRVSRSLRALARVTREVTERGERGEHARWLLDATIGTRIAEVRQVAGAFRGTLRRLEERLAYNQEFASNVSHEFRTPLTTLRGTVDLLRDDQEMPLEQRLLFLDNARTDLDRLLRMLQGLLELARVDANDANAPVELDLVVGTVVARAPGVVAESGASAVIGDAALLELAVRNLIDNARLHGGPHVSVRGWTRGARTGVDVEDDGDGISAANLPRVFDRFFTTGRDRQGTGLGLAIVRAVARAHGGDVRVESRPGRTVFTVELPRVVTPG